MGITVGISLLSCVQAEIYVIEDLRHHLGFFTFGYLLISDYLGLVTKAFPLSPSGYTMATERMDCGFIPPSSMRVK